MFFYRNIYSLYLSKIYKNLLYGNCNKFICLCYKYKKVWRKNIYVYLFCFIVLWERERGEGVFLLFIFLDVIVLFLV